MTDPTDAERLAEIRDYMKAYEAHVGGSVDTGGTDWVSGTAFLLHIVDRLTKERDEARRSAEALRTTANSLVYAIDNSRTDTRERLETLRIALEAYAFDSNMEALLDNFDAATSAEPPHD